MTSGTLRNQHQGLHYLTDTVSVNVKALFTQLNTLAPTAIRRIHFSMNMLSRRMKNQYICSEGWPPAPGVKYNAREGQASTYLLDVCPGLLQLHRDFLSLFISMAKKAEAFFNRSLSLYN